MSHIAGVSSEDSDAADSLAIMLETLRPKVIAKIDSEDNRFPPLVSSIVKDAHSNKALAELSYPIERKPIEQPHIDPDSNLVLIYDGELYNAQEIASKLEQRHSLVSQVSAESLVYLMGKSVV